MAVSARIPRFVHSAPHLYTATIKKGTPIIMNRDYKLLTPGPLTTTRTVKEEMLFDHCTWDDDYKAITQKIRTDLLELAHCDPSEYTAVLMQGSGTFGVESVLTSVIGADEKVLLCTNGAYGDRQVKICEHAGIDYVQYAESYDRIPDAAHVAEILDNDPSITHVSMIHSETTSGLLNDIESVARVAKAHGCTFIVDAMSSFGGVDIPMADWGIDFLVSSANKCIQGVPGFSFIICNTAKLEASRGKARSLSLDLWDQWNTLEKDGGKWRYTSPTHVVLAFNRALDEMKAEGGIPARSARYDTNNRMLIARMKALGFGTFQGASGSDHHHLHLPGGRELRLRRHVRVHQGARLRHLPGQADRRGDVPPGQHRRDLPRRHPSRDRAVRHVHGRARTARTLRRHHRHRRRHRGDGRGVGRPVTNPITA